VTEIRLVKYRDTKEEFLDLFRAAFGQEMSSGLWDWKYIENPLVVGDPDLVVALDGGKVVGARPFLLAEMWINDRKVKAAQPCDTMVHPKYRGQGLFGRMNQFAIDYFEGQGCALFYNFPNSMSRLGYLGQGWRLVSSMESLFHVLNARNVISYRVNSRLLGLALGSVYNMVPRAGRKESLSLTGFRMGISDHFTPELKEDSLRENWGIDLVRSEAYMKWRFEQHPEHKYTYVIAKERDEVKGYAVISIQEQDERLRHGMIVDYLVKDNSIDCFHDLMTECIQQLKKKCDIISAWASPHSGFTDELIKNGFKTSSKFPYNRVFQEAQFVAREVNTQAIGSFDIYDKDNWRVTRAYADFA